MLLRDKCSQGCNLLLGFEMPALATAGAPCAHSPVFSAKLTDLLTEVRSVHLWE